MGNIISQTYSLLKRINPDCVFILGDTNSGLAVISAKRLKIPIFHMEAGNRCYDQNVPEEINRKIIDHTSDINICYTENSRRYLLAEGFQKDRVFVIGSPMTEIIKYYADNISCSTILQHLDVKPQQYILLSLHREENVDIEKNFRTILNSLDKICDHFKIPILFSAHPRTEDRLRKYNIQLPKLIQQFKAIGFFDYCKLQKNAYVVLSDSGTITEESAIIGFPAVSVRTSTERPEGNDCGTIVLGNLYHTHLINSIRISVDTYIPNLSDNIPYNYENEHVAMRLIKIIQSYTPIIKRRVWFQDEQGNTL